MPYEKTKHLGAIVFFFFSIDINILYIILHMRLNYILLPVLLREMAAVSVVCSAVIFYQVPFNKK